MTILYLYSELVGYNMPIFKLLVEKYKAKIHVIHWDKKKLKPFEPEIINNVYYYPRSKFCSKQLKSFVIDLAPNLVYISGWMDKGYLPVALLLKNKNVPIVVGFDDIWTGSLRQKLGALFFPIFFKKYFSYAWVAGPYQFEFAKKLGFKNSEIIFDLLTADTNIFNDIEFHYKPVSKSFIYVGNFRKVKGVDILIESFKIYKSKYKGDWSLKIIGNGELYNYLHNIEGVYVSPFSSSTELLEFAKNSDVFILPSRHDQWGVVVHEFISLGLPLILSSNVGSGSTFFINGFNGYRFNNNSVNDLAQQMYNISILNLEDFRKMQKASIFLSKRINVESSVANLISILIKN